MGILDFLNNNSNLLLVLANLCLVFVTIIYVGLNMKILKLTQRQIGLLQIPIIGIEIDDMYINEDKYGGDLQVILKISNLGTVPALEIKVDSEIKLKYSKYGDEKIPSTDGLSFHPFLRAGEVLSQNSDFISVTQFYDSLFAKNLMLNFKKNNELNEERLKNAQEVKHDSATLSIYIYYKNNLNQNFRSYFETNIVTDFGRNKQANPSDESQHLIQIYLQNRKFCSEPISEREFFEEIKKREVKRKKIQEMA